jgi:predicted kinase
MRLIIMRGIPGSGKSTVAQGLADKLDARVFSTDDYWYREDPMVYKWDADKIGEAHQWNQDRTESAMKVGYDVIIDNTNLDQYAADPYIKLAKQYGYRISVVTVDTDIKTCIERNHARKPDRRVPDDVVLRMHEKLRANIILH